MDTAMRIRIEALRKWQAGETPGPVEMTVMPATRCNLRCSICRQRKARKDWRRSWEWLRNAKAGH